MEISIRSTGNSYFIPVPGGYLCGDLEVRYACGGKYHGQDMNRDITCGWFPSEELAKVNLEIYKKKLEGYNVHPYPISIPKAAELLDKVEPNWFTKIDLDKLNMSSSKKCILGQVYGSYEEGYKTLFSSMYISPPKNNVFGEVVDGKEKWTQEINKRKLTVTKIDIHKNDIYGYYIKVHKDGKNFYLCGDLELRSRCSGESDSDNVKIDRTCGWFKDKALAELYVETFTAKEEGKDVHPMPFSIDEAAKFLDKVKPDWYTKIDISSLDMGLPETCILGQVFGNYFKGMKTLFGSDFGWADGPFGINASVDDWIVEIINRRGQNKLGKLEVKEETTVRKYVELPSKVYIDEIDELIAKLQLAKNS